MSNLTTKSIPVFYFSFTSRAKLMVQERVGIAVPEVSALTHSHVGCHPRILWLVTFTSLLWWWQWPKCHQALFVRLPRSKAALIYILYLCLLCVKCGCACNIYLLRRCRQRKQNVGRCKYHQGENIQLFRQLSGCVHLLLVLIHVSCFAVANKAFGDNYFNLHFMSKETQNSFQQIFNW